MRVVAVGVSHPSAPLAIRERLALTAEAGATLLARAREAGAEEVAVLATCGRTELYAAGRDVPPDADALATLLAEAGDAPLADLQPYLERRHGRYAIVHLLRVASGVDSLVVGESEILGQVARAGERAERAGASGPVLARVFGAAVRAGRRARAETAIGAKATSVPAVAVEEAQRVLGTLAGRVVLVLGAGETSQLAVRALMARGAAPPLIMNRTLAHAEALAAAFAARVAPLDRLTAALESADVVVASTGAPQALLAADDVRRAMRGRRDRPLAIVDMAVPRDVDPAVRDLPGVHYFDLDDLARAAEENLNGRRAEVPRVEAIVAEETERVLDWMRTASVTPAIASLRSRAEAIREAEVVRALRRLPRLSERERRALEAFSKSLVKKLLHDPTSVLKAEAGNGRAAELTAALRRLFALDAGDPDRREP
ncbi:MAG: glutamyl-tRNA reductase [Gemmatimonadetes bacterium]|nr:glutamyl-tRNA reductase [Gemmatimonadota bacterium]